jgi:hypothetical protein
LTLLPGRKPNRELNQAAQTKQTYSNYYIGDHAILKDYEMQESQSNRKFILMHVLPFYILVTTTFKAFGDTSSNWVMPGYLYLGNFKDAWKEAHLADAFLSNTIVTVVSVVLIVIIRCSKRVIVCREEDFRSRGVKQIKSSS